MRASSSFRAGRCRLGLGTWCKRGSQRCRCGPSRAGGRLPAHRYCDGVWERRTGGAGGGGEACGARRSVTTKPPPSRAGRERATLEDSLDALGFGMSTCGLTGRPADALGRRERLLELQADGLAREVGVSNYSVRQLDELERATGRLPTVNQIEWSPCASRPARARGAPQSRCAARGYSPLKTVNLLDPQLARIADRHESPCPSRPPLAHRASDRRDLRSTNASGSPRTQPSSASSYLRPRSSTSTGSSRQGRDDAVG